MGSGRCATLPQRIEAVKVGTGCADDRWVQEYYRRVMRLLVAAMCVSAWACGNDRGGVAPGGAAGGANETRPAEAAMVRGLVAHRGASAEAPENTLAALRLGWAMGAESCEIDVRVTLDGQVVLMH